MSISFGVIVSGGLQHVALLTTVAALDLSNTSKCISLISEAPIVDSGGWWWSMFLMISGSVSSSPWSAGGSRPTPKFANISCGALVADSDEHVSIDDDGVLVSVAWGLYICETRVKNNRFRFWVLQRECYEQYLWVYADLSLVCLKVNSMHSITRI